MVLVDTDTPTPGHDQWGKKAGAAEQHHPRQCARALDEGFEGSRPVVGVSVSNQPHRNARTDFTPRFPYPIVLLTGGLAMAVAHGGSGLCRFVRLQARGRGFRRGGIGVQEQAEGPRGHRLEVRSATDRQEFFLNVMYHCSFTVLLSSVFDKIACAEPTVRAELKSDRRPCTELLLGFHEMLLWQVARD